MRGAADRLCSGEAIPRPDLEEPRLVANDANRGNDFGILAPGRGLNASDLTRERPAFVNEGHPAAQTGGGIDQFGPQVAFALGATLLQEYQSSSRHVLAFRPAANSPRCHSAMRFLPTYTKPGAKASFSLPQEPMMFGVSFFSLPALAEIGGRSRPPVPFSLQYPAGVTIWRTHIIRESLSDGAHERPRAWVDRSSLHRR
jgi:hypothetical protein